MYKATAGHHRIALAAKRRTGTRRPQSVTLAGWTDRGGTARGRPRVTYSAHRPPLNPPPTRSIPPHRRPSQTGTRGSRITNDRSHQKCYIRRRVCRVAASAAHRCVHAGQQASHASRLWDEGGSVGATRDAMGCITLSGRRRAYATSRISRNRSR